MRRGFTLIELLVVIGIMGTMATVGVVSLSGSRGSTRLFAATRDAMAMVRRARSIALVTQKPVVLTYANGTEDGEAIARLEIKSAKLFNAKKETGVVRNLMGEIVSGEEETTPASDAAAAKKKAGEESESATDESSGETIEDILSPEAIDSDVVRGLKLKVLPIDEQLEMLGSEVKHSSISIFSTADNVSRTYDSGKTAENASTEGLQQATEEPVKVVFAVNGTVDPPHRVWIYKEESSPEKGLCIEVDRYGEPTCKDIADQ